MIENVQVELIKRWILAAPGVFSVREVDYDLEFDDPSLRYHRTQILEMFVQEGLISNTGYRRGYYKPCHRHEEE